MVLLVTYLDHAEPDTAIVIGACAGLAMNLKIHDLLRAASVSLSPDRLASAMAYLVDRVPPASFRSPNIITGQLLQRDRSRHRIRRSD